MRRPSDRLGIPSDGPLGRVGPAVGAPSAVHEYHRTPLDGTAPDALAVVGLLVGVAGAALGSRAGARLG